MADSSSSIPERRETEAGGGRRSGFATALDICIAPRTALTNLREKPTWVWAFLVAAALGMISAAAVSPTVAHVLGIELASKLSAAPQIAHLPADQRDSVVAQQISLAQTFARFGFVFVPFGLALSCAFQALIMLIASAVSRGDGTFKKLWALAVNAAMIGTGLASVALMLIVLIRGPAGFESSSDISGALPGLGTLVPTGARAASAFFSVFNVFAIWDMVLLGAGMIMLARVPRATAIFTAALILGATGLLPLIGAAFQK